jgi:hypothetical protein
MSRRNLETKESNDLGRYVQIMRENNKAGKHCEKSNRKEWKRTGGRMELILNEWEECKMEHGMNKLT